MKNLKLLFAALVVSASIISCAPNHEEIIPSGDNQDKTEFPVKNTDGDNGTTGPKPKPGGE